MWTSVKIEQMGAINHILYPLLFLEAYYMI